MTPFEGKRMLIFWVWQWRDPATGRADASEGWLLLWCCTPLLLCSVCSNDDSAGQQHTACVFCPLRTAVGSIRCCSILSLLQKFISLRFLEDRILETLGYFHVGEDRRDTHWRRSLDAVMFSVQWSPVTSCTPGPGRHQALGTRSSESRENSEFLLSSQRSVTSPGSVLWTLLERVSHWSRLKQLGFHKFSKLLKKKPRWELFLVLKCQMLPD